MQLATQLAGTLYGKLDQTIARDDYWFDPYVGLRGRYNFNKRFTPPYVARSEDSESVRT